LTCGYFLLFHKTEIACFSPGSRRMGRPFFFSKRRPDERSSSCSSLSHGLFVRRDFQVVSEPQSVFSSSSRPGGFFLFFPWGDAVSLPTGPAPFSAPFEMAGFPGPPLRCRPFIRGVDDRARVEGVFPFPDRESPFFFCGFLNIHSFFSSAGLLTEGPPFRVT